MKVSMKIFKDTGRAEQLAHFGWQDKNQALYGLREGYKTSADKLVEIALKHIYQRAKGEIPVGGHNLLILWDNVQKDIIDGMICSQPFIKLVKSYKVYASRLEGLLENIAEKLKEIPYMASSWRSGGSVW